MRRLSAVMSVVIVAAALLVAYAAHAAARQDGDSTTESGFVGSWRVEVSIPGQGGYSALATYMADGTTIHSRTLAQAGPSEQPGDIMLISPAHGVWEANGDRESRTTFVGLNTDAQGNFIGSGTVSGTQRLSEDGQSYIGEYMVTVVDPGGNVVATIPGTATAVRINVEPVTLPGTPGTTPVT